jgi:hypothetical protein
MEHKEYFMKSKTIFFMFFIIYSVFGLSVWADELSTDLGTLPKFTFGGGATISSLLTGGGFGEFSFRLFNRDRFYLRNHVVLFGAGIGDNSGFFTLSEKLSFGGFTASKINSLTYGYVEGGIGFWGTSVDMDYSKIPWAFSFGGGSGTDIFLDEDSSLYLEAGCLMIILNQQWKFVGKISLGWNGWFGKK